MCVCVCVCVCLCVNNANAKNGSFHLLSGVPLQFVSISHYSCVSVCVCVCACVCACARV